MVRLSGPDDDGCKVLVTVPDGQVVQVAFEEFMVKKCGGGTGGGSHVQVFDGSTVNDPRIGDFCGVEERRRPKLVRSSGAQMFVVVSLADGEAVVFRWSAETGG